MNLIVVHTPLHQKKQGGLVITHDITLIKLTSNTIFDWLTKATEWVGIKTVIMVTRTAESTTSKPSPTPEKRYFISSLSLDCKQMLEISIAHWRVETLRQILDDVKAFSEDKRKVYRGNGPEFLSIMRKIGINLLLPFNRYVDKESFRAISDMCKMCIEFLDAILTKHPDEVGTVKKWRKDKGEGLFANIVPI
jgi:predicted transposase YbfD/YdcC